MHWNYRIMNVPSEMEGHDWFEVKEVYYNDDGSLFGYGDAYVDGETLEDVQATIRNIFEAAQKPALHEDDFKGATRKEEDE